jgi:hypothetical protein
MSLGGVVSPRIEKRASTVSSSVRSKTSVS